MSCGRSQRRKESNSAKGVVMALKVLYFDIETTGLECKEHDIVHLAMIAEVNGKVVGEHEFRMRPRRFDNIHPEALKANGFTLDELKALPPQEEVFPEIVAALDTYIDKFDRSDKFYPVGYNVRFDIGFVVELFKNNKNDYLGSYFNWRDVDLLYLMYVYEFMGHHKLPNYRMETVSTYYGIKHAAHDALSDTRVVRELTHKFLMPYIRMEAHEENPQ